MRAYFDSSAVNHLYDRVLSGDEPALAIATAVMSGELAVPGSMVVSEELIQTTDKDRRFALGTFYGGMIERGRRVAHAPTLLEDEVRAYARGDAPPSPYTAMTASLMGAWVAMMMGRVPVEVTDRLAESTRLEVDANHARMRELAPQGRAVMARKRESGIPDPSFEELWAEGAPYYTFAWAFRAGVGDECFDRGLGGLLDRPAVRAAVGFEVVQAYAQPIKGERPDRGDHNDFLHFVSAAAVGGLFVSEDGRLRARVNTSPGRPADAIGLDDSSPVSVSRACRRSSRAGRAVPQPFPRASWHRRGFQHPPGRPRGPIAEAHEARLASGSVRAPQAILGVSRMRRRSVTAIDVRVCRTSALSRRMISLSSSATSLHDPWSDHASVEGKSAVPAEASSQRR